jgi:hypothetical protein
MFTFTCPLFAPPASANALAVATTLRHCVHCASCLASVTSSCTCACSRFSLHHLHLHFSPSHSTTTPSHQPLSLHNGSKINHNTTHLAVAVKLASAAHSLRHGAQNTRKRQHFAVSSHATDCKRVSSRPVTRGLSHAEKAPQRCSDAFPACITGCKHHGRELAYAIHRRRWQQRCRRRGHCALHGRRRA